MGEVLLRAAGLVKDYPGLRALDNVDFELRRDEIHALIGQNGAGKSTLIKILGGAARPDAGQIWLNGQAVRFRSTADAFAAGLSVLHQELSLVPALSAAENIFLGRPYPTRGMGLVDWRELHRRARAILSGLGAEIPVHRPVSQLSPAHRTLVAIARALSANASILILDEPTASLTGREVSHLFKIVRALRDRGTAIIYVSHRLHELFALSDRMTVLRDGKVVGTYHTGEIDGPDLVRLMTGRNVTQAFPPRQGSPGPVVLEARRLSDHTLRNVSFALRRGEVMGIAGLTGSGRSELLRLLTGVQKPTGGAAILQGQAVPIRSPQAALSRGIAMVPEERRSQGLILHESVSNNITLAHLSSFAKGGLWLSSRSQGAAVRDLVQRLQIRLAHVNQPAGQLSGGNQQKVVFAKFLARPLQVLLLDEPTRGIDVSAKVELYEIIRKLADQGTAILLVSSELGELLGLSDRILVLNEGAVAALADAESFTEDSLSSYMYGRQSA